MKIRLVKTNSPAESPGVWRDSILKLYLKADKIVIEAVYKAIKDALAKS